MVLIAHDDVGSNVPKIGARLCQKLRARLPMLAHRTKVDR